LLAIKECLFVEDDILSRDNDIFVWNPDPVNIGRVIVNEVTDMGLWI